MSRAKVLIPMHADWPLFGDAGADAVGPLDILGPDAAEPGPPVLELAGQRLLSAMIDRDSVRVTEQHDVIHLLHDRIQAIDFFRGVRKNVAQRLGGGANLVRGENVGSCRARDVYVMLERGSFPGRCDVVHVQRGSATVRSQESWSVRSCVSSSKFHCLLEACVNVLLFLLPSVQS